MFAKEAGRRGEQALLRDISASLQVQQVDAPTRKVLLQVAERVFGDLEHLRRFREKLTYLWSHDGLPTHPSRDHFSIYPVEILRVLNWVSPDRAGLPHAVYLASAYISHVEAQEEPYSPDEWRTMFRNLQKVPLEYLDGVFDGSDEIFPYTLEAVRAWWGSGLTATYAGGLTLRGKVLPDLGYTLEEALRLQEAEVDPPFANQVYYQAKGPAVETALVLSKAGVPHGYAHAMLQAGIPYRTIAEMYLFQVPLEYALMMANVGRMDG